MNINQLIQDSKITAEPQISVFILDVNECHISLKVNHPLTNKMGGMDFKAIINFDLNLDNRKAILYELEKHIKDENLNFVAVASDEMLEFLEKQDPFDSDVYIYNQEEFVSPYSSDINQKLTSYVVDAIEKNELFVTFI